MRAVQLRTEIWLVSSLFLGGRGPSVNWRYSALPQGPVQAKNEELSQCRGQVLGTGRWEPAATIGGFASTKKARLRALLEAL